MANSDSNHEQNQKDIESVTDALRKSVEKKFGKDGKKNGGDSEDDKGSGDR